MNSNDASIQNIIKYIDTLTFEPEKYNQAGKKSITTIFLLLRDRL